jgi:hypothetical protein
VAAERMGALNRCAQEDPAPGEDGGYDSRGRLLVAQTALMRSGPGRADQAC